MSDTEQRDDFEQLGEAAKPEAEASAGGDCAPAASGGQPAALCCSFMEHVDPRVKELVLWSDPRRSGAALFTLGTMLWACMSQSFVSVLAYMGLAALLCTCALRLYAYTMKKPGAESGDLLRCLQEPVSLPKKRIAEFVESHVECAERELNCLLDLLLFRDSIRTLKFFVGLILLTYVGSWFNALTLVTMAVLCVFTLPKAYSVHHQRVDALAGMVLEQYRQVNAKIRAAIPFGKEKKN